MIYELPASLFYRAVPLFRGAWFDEAYIDAVFEGRQPGRIFVDDPALPTAALMCRTYEFFVGGDAESAEMLRFILDVPEEPGAFQSLYGFAPIGDEWKQAILSGSGERLLDVGRRGFKFVGPALAAVRGWTRSSAGGVQIVRVGAALAERIDREMGQRIGFYWDGYERFEQLSFAYCALVDGQVASVAYAGAVSSREANIDVETVERFRRRGLSELSAQACIRHCLERGLVATWDTDDVNVASLAVARKLGFVEYPPFSELSPPRGTSLELSRGLWRPAEDASGISAWRRAADDRGV